MAKEKYIEEQILKYCVKRQLDPSGLHRFQRSGPDDLYMPDIDSLNNFLKENGISAEAVDYREGPDIVEYDIKPDGITIRELQDKHTMLAPFFKQKDVNIEWHPGSSYVSLSYRIRKGPLYLGDFIMNSELTSPTYMFGVDSMGRPVTYSPLETGNLLISSASQDQITKVIDSIFIHMNCIENDSSSEVYLIYSNNRYDKLLDSPLLKKNKSGRQETMEFLELVKKDVEYRKSVYRRSHDKKIFVIIPDISVLLGGYRYENIRLLKSLLLESNRLGIYFIVGCRLNVRTHLFKSIRNSFGGLISFRSYNEMIDEATPDLFIYYDCNRFNRTYGMALEADSEDLDSLASLDKDSSEILKRYEKRIPYAVEAMDVISIVDGVSMKVLMESLSWTKEQAEDAVSLLEDIHFISPPNHDGKRNILISYYFWSIYLKEEKV